jgi:hypothetical protein
VEGNVNRIKTLKRQMYGRANFGPATKAGAPDDLKLPQRTASHHKISDRTE